MNHAWLHHDPEATIRRQAVELSLRETGGPLFGYESADGDLVICEAYGPGPRAKRAQFRLVADMQHTQKLIDEVHRRTDGVLSYLGDWHTHPGGRPAPSGTDARTLAALAQDDGMAFARPVALIVVTGILPRRSRVRTLRCWRWDPDCGVPSELPLARCA